VAKVVETVLAVDVGATNLRVALFDLGGNILHKEVVRTPTAGDDYTIAREIYRIGNKLLGRISKARLMSIGVGTIGPLDIRKGEVINAPNNPLRRFKLKEPLTRMFNVSTYVVNDCVAAVWGEYLVGIGRGYSNIVYITLSTGIGAGVIVDNHLLLGKNGNAHEVGHIVIDFKRRIRCGCGGLGHWESIASGSAIPRYALLRARKWRGENTDAFKKALAGLLRPEDLFSFWRNGDTFARSIVRDLIEVNAAGIASVINVYDPEVVSVGGSIALKNPDFMKLIFKNVRRYVTNRMPKLTLTPLGDDAVLIGAAYIAMRPPKELLKLQCNS